MPAWLKSPLLIIVCTQMLFTGGDLLARANMKALGFRPAAFLTWWFLGYTLLRQIATFGQLYVFANINLGKSMAFFGAVSIVLSNLLGLLLLGEVLSWSAYLGVSLAILAFLALALL